MDRNDRIDELTRLATRMKESENEINHLEKQLKIAKEYHNKLSFEEIPVVMMEIGMTSFTLSDGTHFAIKPVLDVRAPKDKMDKVDDWLEKNGHGGMVKYAIDIGKQYLPKVEKILDQYDISYETKKTIHYQTLNAWAREMEINGYVIPEDLFSVSRVNKTVIE